MPEILSIRTMPESSALPETFELRSRSVAVKSTRWMETTGEPIPIEVLLDAKFDVHGTIVRDVMDQVSLRDVSVWFCPERRPSGEPPIEWAPIGRIDGAGFEPDPWPRRRAPADDPPSDLRQAHPHPRG